MRIINCTGKPLHVLVDGKPVILPEAPQPSVSNILQDSADETFETEEGEFVLKVQEETAAEVTLFMPVEKEDVTYLVPPETLLRSPERKDFIAPVSYSMTERNKGKKIKWLVNEVTRSLLPVDENTVAIAADSFKEVTAEEMIN